MIPQPRLPGSRIPRFPKARAFRAPPGRLSRQIPRVSARPRRPVPGSNPAGPPPCTGCPERRRDWRTPSRVNGVTPLLPPARPRSASPTRAGSEAVGCSGMLGWGVHLSDRDPSTPRVPPAADADRPAARAPWSLGRASLSLASEPGLAQPGACCGDPVEHRRWGAAV